MARILEKIQGDGMMEKEAKCPNCKTKLRQVPIQKGSKMEGINYFCATDGCNYEEDDYGTGKPTS